MALAAVLLGALLAAALAAPDPDRLERAAIAEVSTCLVGERWRLDARHVAVPSAPLGLPARMVAARVVDAPGRLVVYQDGGGRVLECGVMVYDPLPDGAPGRFADEVTRDKPTLEPARATAWRLDAGAGLPARYWALSRAPGLDGVLLKYGGDGVDAPRVLVDSHSVLIH